MYDAGAVRGLEEELGIKGGKLKKLGKLGKKEGVSSFMVVYSLVWNKPIKKWDKDGIEKLEWHDLKEVRGMVKKDPKKFKGDFPRVFNEFYKN